MLPEITILVFSTGYFFTLVSGDKEYIPFVCSTIPDEKTQFKEAHDYPDLDIGVRSFLLNKRKHWPRGIVPYQLDRTFSQQQVMMLKNSMAMIEEHSCVRWVPRTIQRDYVKINRYPVEGVCTAQVGHYGYEQDINLSDICFNISKGYKGAILHEMMHTLGFIHEQQRLDRDCFVNVTSQGIERQPADYAKVPATSIDFPYDFRSIMHYGTNHIIQSKNKETMGHINGSFTELDIMKLNNMYCGGLTYCEKNPRFCSWIEDNQKKCVTDLREYPVKTPIKQLNRQTPIKRQNRRMQVIESTVIRKPQIRRRRIYP